MNYYFRMEGREGEGGREREREEERNNNNNSNIYGYIYVYIKRLIIINILYIRNTLFRDIDILFN